MSTDIQANSKRMAKNSVYLYFRMFLLMIVSLYTSRIVLQVLGVEDYGIYNVVGGFVSILAFIISSLANTSQRYINLGLGANDIQLSRTYFRQSVTLLSMFAIVLIILAETVGLWFVLNKLTIPEDRMTAAIWIYQFSVATTAVSMLQVTYQADIIANEKMNIYAYLGLFDAFAKLAICYVIQLSAFDSLITYGALLMGVSFLSFAFHVLYVYKHFEEASFGFQWDKKLVLEMSGFVGSNVYGCLAYALGVQGTNVLLNMFFGPIVNAARGISLQVRGIISRFTANILTAVKPQIIKSYSAGENEYLTQLIIKSTKYILFISVLLGLPVVSETPFLLNLWLGQVPDYSVSFTRMAIAEVACETLVEPLLITTIATGYIKRNQVYGRTLTLLSLPLGYLVLKVFPYPNLAIVIIVIMSIAYWIYCLWDVHSQIKINAMSYAKGAIIPGSILALAMAVVALLVHALFTDNTLFTFVIRSTICVLMGLITTYALLDTSEKQYIYKIVNKLRKKI